MNDLKNKIRKTINLFPELKGMHEKQWNPSKER